MRGQESHMKGHLSQLVCQGHGEGSRQRRCLTEMEKKSSTRLGKEEVVGRVWQSEGMANSKTRRKETPRPVTLHTVRFAGVQHTRQGGVRGEAGEVGRS